MALAPPISEKIRRESLLLRAADWPHGPAPCAKSSRRRAAGGLWRRSCRPLSRFLVQQFDHRARDSGLRLTNGLAARHCPFEQIPLAHTLGYMTQQIGGHFIRNLALVLSNRLERPPQRVT